MIISLLLMTLKSALAGNHPSANELLDRYASNQDKIRSWIIRYEMSAEIGVVGEKVEKRVRSCELRLDDERTSSRVHKWGDYGGEQILQSNSTYISLTWDGQRYIKYRKKGNNEPGLVYVDRFEDADQSVMDWELNSLRYKHDAACLMGFYIGTFERIDKVLRNAREISVRSEPELIGGVKCHVIDAKTKYGDYTLWIDPQHGYNIARAHIWLSKDENHFEYDKPTNKKIYSNTLEIIRFEQIDGLWFPVEAEMSGRQLRDNPEAKPYTGKIHFKVNEMIPNPDHEASRSFVGSDVPNGTKTVIVPVLNIVYTWQDGKLIKRINEKAIARIDKIVDDMVAQDKVPSMLANGLRSDVSEPVSQDESQQITTDGDQQQSALSALEADNKSTEQAILEEGSEAHMTDKEHLEPGKSPLGSQGKSLPQSATGDSVKAVANDGQSTETSESVSSNRDQLRPHCGLYCIYSILKLTGQKIDFRELVKTDYFGSRKGSSLAELQKAAHDYGFHAGIAARLTTRVLRNSPYPAILHVKSNGESDQYDHFELFMGTQNGQAKLFNPPESPRLVPFYEVAPLWDGLALFVSAKPFDIDAIFNIQRDRLIVYAVIGILAIIIVQLARRLCLVFTYPLSRRWQLGLSVAQGTAIGIVALLCGMIYHFTYDGGLLANTNAVASLQRGHAGNFIPKVSEKEVRKRLNTDTIFIDARLARDFKIGHLEGAISVPIDANDLEYQSVTSKITNDACIIVYCQSARCKFAERVAVKLVSDGFSDISIFKGGWAEWIDKNGEPPTKKTFGKQNGERHEQT